ncbi:SLC13 family permease [Aerosticca soli]|uniref:Anion permease ArsB/NhaD-like n=1 Tax=Aerosticca soli TaxID=2010829 RepID=A0A2Z6E793_9GAMM|nr:SLC13 family permease [Aerosticca soli]BBD80369.1 anion permease ArsB/NhaD-like [Aerosticca soli]
MKPVEPPSRWLTWLAREWMLLVFALLAVLLALLDPQPAAHYAYWLRTPTLAGLLGLMLAIQGIRDSGAVQRLAVGVVARTHSLRVLGLTLVTATALAATVLTNDVSLFLLVPLTLAIGEMSNLPVKRMVVLEALAVNAGSSLSPIGNPQNLLLWQHGGMSFFDFTLALLPAAVTMFALVAVLAWCWLPRGRVTLDAGAFDGHRVAWRSAVLSLLALAGMVLAMEHGHALAGALTLLVLYALFSRRTTARLDWALLVTFAAIFLGLGHLAALPAVQHLLDGLDLRQPWIVYVTGIAASQLISNVPATVLLMDRVPDTVLLAVAVNVGGFGVAIGSLANLIALRLARQPGGLGLLHRASIPFLLVCAPLVYLIARYLA